MNRDHHLLWEFPDSENDGTVTSCVMVSCCAGAELQVIRSAATEDEQVVLRELYPDHDSLYERARELRVEMARGSRLMSDPA